MLYLKPRLAESAMRARYERLDYFEGEGSGYVNYAAQEGTLRSTFRGLLHGMWKRGLTSGRLLEVGCAFGFFLEEARPYFSYRVGTDYSAEALDRAAGRAERLVLGGPSEVSAREPFDCAVCVHVIEHVYEPVEWLTDIRNHVRPGGWVVVATPDAGAPWRSLMGARWPFWKVPEHVTFYDHGSLARLLATVGLVDVIRLPYPSIFPLGLAVEKVGARLPRWAWSLPVRLPFASLCLAAQRPLASHTTTPPVPVAA
jgi:2-polyprenyl-3-methyl-5-hydroxy-6-metoxy-1,4-benzoquinol methylase